MKELVASDVIYIRSKDATEAALANAEVDQQVLPSVFVPHPSQWLDTAAFAPLIGSSSGATATGGSACPPGKVCGLGLTSTSVGGAALTAGASNTVTGSSLDIAIQNQGDVTESNVEVTAKAGGSSASETIPSIAAGATKTVTVDLKPPPKSGDSGTLTVSVQTVPGERVSSNNRASYTVTFSG
jgi:hypothetical protein